MTVLLDQFQNNIRTNPHLNLVLTSLTDNSKIERVQALVDTGFDGAICISERIKNKLELQLIYKVRTENADNQVVGTDVAGVAAVFLSLEGELTEYRVPALIKDIKFDCIIGMRLLQLFAKDNHAHLLFDFLQDRIQFVGV